MWNKKHKRKNKSHYQILITLAPTIKYLKLISLHKNVKQKNTLIKFRFLMIDRFIPTENFNN